MLGGGRVLLGSSAVSFVLVLSAFVFCFLFKYAVYNTCIDVFSLYKYHNMVSLTQRSLLLVFFGKKRIENKPTAPIPIYIHMYMAPMQFLPSCADLDAFSRRSRLTSARNNYFAFFLFFLWDPIMWRAQNRHLPSAYSYTQGVRGRPR